MTCIVGLVHNGITYIGGDSLGSSNYSKAVRLDKKVFHIKDINNAIMGFTSSYRMGQLLMYGTGLIDSRDVLQNEIDHEYLVTKFIPNVIDLFEKGGYSRTRSGEKEGGTFLFGYRGNLYKIDSDFQVAEAADKYDACGSGADFALGSLFSTKNVDDPLLRIKKALQAASTYAIGVEPPYYIINTNNRELTTYRTFDE